VFDLLQHQGEGAVPGEQESELTNGQPDRPELVPTPEPVSMI